MTDCDRLLAALSDGREHEARELYRLGMIVHSRAADLRRKGHRIVCRKAAGEYFYRLEPLEGAASTPAAPSSGSVADASLLGAGPLDTQLTLEAA